MKFKSVKASVIEFERVFERFMGHIIKSITSICQLGFLWINDAKHHNCPVTLVEDPSIEMTRVTYLANNVEVAKSTMVIRMPLFCVL
jgi:hypothetical protein